MAYRFDGYDQSVVIDGWQTGIAPDPYDGIANLQNINTVSVPGEAAVNFGTIKISSPTVTGATVASAHSGTAAGYITFTGNVIPTGLDGGMAVSFPVSNISGLTGGTTVYWVSNFNANGAGTAEVYTDYATTTHPNITGSGTASVLVYAVDFSTYQGNQPNKFAVDPTLGNTYMVDAMGRVWSNKFLTVSNSYWTFTGNQRNNNGDVSNGNGIVFYEGSDGKGWIFVYSDSSIDYTQTATNSFNWVYGWNPATGSTNQAAPYLNAGASSGASHESLVGQDNVVYYCDTHFLGSFFEKSGSNFNPTDNTTYTFAKQALKLPVIEQALCLAELGINLLVGGIRNLIYPWNRTATSFTYPIWLAEEVVQKMITVNTNTYIYVGNRGRIYITNGTQAQLYKKLPDHLSNTIEPYFQWGGVSSSKNQMYFSAKATTNVGSALSTYGGIWAIDLDTGALRMINELSYNTTNGYAPSLVAINPLVGASTNTGNPLGVGFYAGWDSGASTYGIDGTTNTPYTNGTAIVETDLVPIGTFNHPRNFQYVEYKLTKPLVSGESITLNYRTQFGSTYALIGTDSTAGNISNTFPSTWQNAQWIQIQAVMTSTASSPSYVRLKEIRLTGLVGPSLQQQQQFSL